MSPSVMSAVCSDTQFRNQTTRQVHCHERQTWKQVLYFETNLNLCFNLFILLCSCRTSTIISNPKFFKSRQRNVIAPSKFEYGSLKFQFKGFGAHFDKVSSKVGIIAMTTERTQIPFLSDVFVAVASLDQ